MNISRHIIKERKEISVSCMSPEEEGPDKHICRLTGIYITEIEIRTPLSIY